MNIISRSLRGKLVARISAASIFAILEPMNRLTQPCLLLLNLATLGTVANPMPWRTHDAGFASPHRPACTSPELSLQPCRSFSTPLPQCEA